MRNKEITANFMQDLFQKILYVLKIFTISLIFLDSIVIYV